MNKFYNNIPKKKLYYGVVIIAGSFLLLSVLMGIVNNCYSLFIIPITESLGFTRSQYTVCQSLVFLFTMIGAAIGWKLYKAIGMLPVMRAACILLVAAYYLNSAARSLPVFYLLSVVIGFCMGLMTTAPISIILNNWFQVKYGTALGIAFMGSGVGGMIFNPLANAMIAARGWQGAYRLLAICIAAIALPVVFFLLREKPSEGEPSPLAQKTASSAAVPARAKGLVYTPRLVALMGIILVFAITCNMLIYTITPYLQDIGYSSGFAATCASVAMGILAIGKLLEGIMLDRYGVKKCTYLSFSCISIGLLSLAFFAGPIMLVPVMLGVLFGCPYGTVAIPMLAATICDDDNRGATVGMFAAISSFGSALTPVLSGLVFDAANSYVPLFVSSGAAMALVLLGVKKFVQDR